MNSYLRSGRDFIARVEAFRANGGVAVCEVAGRMPRKLVAQSLESVDEFAHRLIQWPRKVVARA